MDNYNNKSLKLQTKLKNKMRERKPQKRDMIEF